MAPVLFIYSLFGLRPMLKIFFREGNEAHPLVDAKELKRVLSALSTKDEARSLDELAGWLESVINSTGLTPLQLFDIVRQLDEAAQPFIRHLTRAYLSPSQRSRTEEKKLWQLCFGYWDFVANAYHHVVEAFLKAEGVKETAKQAEAIRAQIPLILCRQFAATTASIKWRRFNHEPPLAGSWLEFGTRFLFAEQRKIESEAVTLYPLSRITTTPRREFIKALVFEASSLDSLLPVQIEAVEKLVAFFSPQFVLSRDNRSDNIYWVDASLDHGPYRLARLPKNTPTVRLLGLGEVPAALESMTRQVERGDLPAEPNLAGQYTPKLVLSVLHHLKAYWAVKPPIRKHQRHVAKSRLTVQFGFEACYERMSGVVSAPVSDDFDFCTPGDAWVVDDVSMGGFGVVAPGVKKDWLRVGVLLALQPEESDHWMLGIIRRCERTPENASSVGIQTLARQAACHELMVADAPSRSGQRERAILIEAGEGTNEMKVIFPPATFDLRESYLLNADGKTRLLSPIELLESGGDYQIGRFRVRLVG